MNKKIRVVWWRFWVVGLLSALLTTGLTAPVQAVNYIPATAMQIFEVQPQPLMADFSVMAQVRDAYGKVVPNLQVVISVSPVPQDGFSQPHALKEDSFKEMLGRAETNSQGMALISVSRDLKAGQYWIKAEYRGSREFRSSSALGILTILPAHLVVQTVPALEGVQFWFDGKVLATDLDGKATFDVFAVGKYQLKLVHEIFTTPIRQITFSRWLDEIYAPELEVRIPGTETVQVGFNVNQRVSFAFLDLDGKTVDPERIIGTTIRNIQGETFLLNDTGPNWLPAVRVARRLGGLEATNLLNSVMKVEVDGSNVVNQAQQRFYARPDDLWKITLLLYHMDISVKDAIFGTPVGNSVSIEFPNGEVQEFMLNSQGVASIPSLARGIYFLQVKGASGVTSRTPVALSQNQQADMKVITTLDIALIAVSGLLLALGLLFFGRPWLIPIPGRKSRHAAYQKQLEQGPVTIHEN